MTESQRRLVAGWLLLCAAMVFAIVVVGGITRLTRSGLSIVEWQPLIGIIPPLSEAHWQELFAKYQETPEYKLVNLGTCCLGEWQQWAACRSTIPTGTIQRVLQAGYAIA